MIMMASIFGLARICRREGCCCAGADSGATVSRATLNSLDLEANEGTAEDTGTTLVDSTKHPVAPSRDLTDFPERPMRDYQLQFIDLALALDALRFGNFKLKSGRESPYFFNAGLFADGASMATLGKCYAAALARSGIEFDMIFGPAYKGIPLATSLAIAFAE